MSANKYCPVCGHAYADREHGCSQCTKPIPVKLKFTDPTRDVTTTETTRILWVALAIVILVILIASAAH